jgi:hypothetical protein
VDCLWVVGLVSSRRTDGFWYTTALSQLGLRSFHTTKTCIGMRQSIVRIHNQRCNNVDFLPLTVPSTGIPDALVPAKFFFCTPGGSAISRYCQSPTCHIAVSPPASPQRHHRALGNMTVQRHRAFADVALAGRMTIGVLRRPSLSWISEFPTHRISMSVSHWHPKPALKPETPKKE